MVYAYGINNWYKYDLLSTKIHNRWQTVNNLKGLADDFDRQKRTTLFVWAGVNMSTSDDKITLVEGAVQKRLKLPVYESIFSCIC